MADYFTNFSLVLELPDKAAQDYAINLAGQAHRIHQEEEVPDFPESLLVEIDDWTFETEPECLPDRPGVWLHTENGGVNAACAFIQHLLQRFVPGGHLTFEWSNDSSKPLLDAYGGGAAIITAEEIRTMSTAQWLDQNTADFVL